MLPPADFPMSAADSARAAASVYTASLLAVAPIVVAALAAIALRRASAEARVLVWRAAVGALLAIFVGRALPLRMLGVAVPSVVAEPLIALGRIQVTSLATGNAIHGHFASGPSWIRLAIVAYATGTLLVLGRTATASWRARRMFGRAISLDDDARWSADLAIAREHFGVARRVGIARSHELRVPVTWGLLRPVILVPASAVDWSAERRVMVLRHELAHVRTADWAFGIVARVTCALYWFHPGVWWIADAMRREAEHAADDRVIASGVARSDYAELLAAAAAAASPDSVGAAFALAARGSMRVRLTSILDLSRDVRPLARRWTVAAAAATVVAAAPLTAVELAPTRDVLSSLMRDSRWESRAYAVIGLAHRSDTVAVAMNAAEADPSPRVRAWARYALGLRPNDGPAAPAIANR